MQRSVTKNGITISYELTRKAVKNINLRVRRDGTAAVSAPKTVSAERIDRFVSDNAEKILTAQKQAEDLRRKEEAQLPDISGGGPVILLGEVYAIRFSADVRTPVMDPASRTLVFPKGGDPEAYYKKWLVGYAKEVFTAVLQAVHPRFAPHGIPMPDLRVREMKSRWGSCIPDKRAVTLNLRLIRFPLSSIEYVVVHELCHFPEPNHSARFYRWMDRMFPSWREEKARLKNS